MSDPRFGRLYIWTTSCHFKIHSRRCNSAGNVPFVGQFLHRRAKVSGAVESQPRMGTSGVAQCFRFLFEHNNRSDLGQPLDEIVRHIAVKILSSFSYILIKRISNYE